MSLSKRLRCILTQLLPMYGFAPQGAFSWRLSNAHKVLLDTLESNTRFVCPAWHEWGNPEEGGVIKPSRVIAGEVAPPPTATA